MHIRSASHATDVHSTEEELETFRNVATTENLYITLSICRISSGLKGCFVKPLIDSITRCDCQTSGIAMSIVGAVFSSCCQTGIIGGYPGYLVPHQITR